MTLAQLKAILHDRLWGAQLGALPPWRARAISTLRLLATLVRDVAEGQLTLRAMSLVYTTLLSLVPLLALSFSVLKAFGVHNQIEPLLLNLLAPLGEKGPQISDQIMQFVDNLKVGVLGSIGLALLVYTVVSLIQKIERAFNFIWHVTQQRGLAQRFSEYLSVILVGPVLVFAALGITATIMSTDPVQSLLEMGPLGTAVNIAAGVVPYILVIGAFTFIYVFVPNTKVRLGPALTGAIVAGVLWESAGWAFTSFVVTSTRYTAIYSSFAILIMFMIWLYVSWLILLVGASIAFYRQYPAYLGARPRDIRLSNRLKEKLVLTVICLIGGRYKRGDAPWTLDELIRELGVPMELVDSALAILKDGGLVAQTGDEPPAYLPTRDPAGVRLKDVLDMTRAADEGLLLRPERLVVAPAVEELSAHLEESVAEALGGRSVGDLIGAVAPASPAGSSRPAGDGVFIQRV